MPFDFLAAARAVPRSTSHWSFTVLCPGLDTQSLAHRLNFILLRTAFERASHNQHAFVVTTNRSTERTSPLRPHTFYLAFWPVPCTVNHSKRFGCSVFYTCIVVGAIFSSRVVVGAIFYTRLFISAIFLSSVDFDAIFLSSVVVNPIFR
ncbi:hypothetical protein C8R46DRAFT_1227468 [Mycena filopes]|nr:hypothetical protein C8R46DRAFT_1227468 [Mycena filopes]